MLDPLPVRALWGVGPVAEAGLRRLGVHTVGQLAAMDLREATDLLGSAVGAELHRLARGIDDRPVAPRGAAKQVSAETTFDTDLTAMADVHDAVARMTESAHRRLRRLRAGGAHGHGEGAQRRVHHGDAGPRRPGWPAPISAS